MGIFSDPCPKCGNRVRKGSRFCPKCGEAAPKGLTNCGRCGAEVSSGSLYCWKCGCKLDEMAKPIILGDRWARSGDDFAVRVDNQNVKGWLSKPLIVEHGTRALLFQNGRHKGELAEGRHDVGGFLSRLNHFMIEQNASVVLMDAGDVSLDLEQAGLWTEDRKEITICERIVMRLKDADSLFVNLFKGSNTVRVDDLRAELADEVQMVLSGMIIRFNAAELLTDNRVRDQIQDQLQATLSATLERLGLEIVQLRFVKFECPHAEQMARDEAELAGQEHKAGVSEQRAALNRRLRQTLTQEKMDSFKNDKDFEGFVRQTEHELKLKDVIRDDEVERLKERFRFERDREGVLRRIEIWGIESDAKRKEAWDALIAEEDASDERHKRELDRKLAAAKTDVEVQRAKIDLDDYEAHLGIKRLLQIKEMEWKEEETEHRREEEKADAAHRREMEKIKAQQAAEIEKLGIQRNMTPEQIIALAAEKNPSLGSVLAAKYAAEGKIAEERARILEKQLAEQSRTFEAFADRQERLMKTSLEQMGAVATTRAGADTPRQTIVTGSNGGAPVVIDPRGVAGRCKHCGGSLEPGGGFCPHCGKGQ